MGKKFIISEEEKKHIMGLYEQSQLYQKENEFLKRYVGKTFNIYSDPNFSKGVYGNPYIILSIKYNGGGLDLNVSHSSEPNFHDLRSISCMYNPSKFSYEIKHWDGLGKRIVEHNKTLVDDIMSKGATAGIQWCQKPKADFGSTEQPKNTTV